MKGFPMYVRRAFVAIAAIALVSCSGGDETEQSAASAPEPPPTPTPTVTETTSAPENGEVGTPESIEIPAIDVDAEFVGLGLNDDGSMETPEYDQNLAGWYTEGPMPGEPGPAVVAAHVDNSNGPDTFASLHELEPGDSVTVTDENGQEFSWVVDRMERSDKQQLPYDDIWPETDERMLTLVTCAGAYIDGEYVENLIVYTEESV